MHTTIENIRTFHQNRGDGPFISDDLVAAQHPEVLLVTCSDSRVVPEIVTRAGPGLLFTVRNAGNLLPAPGTGSAEEGTIEYGVAALGIRHLVVCGHTHCGAMKGLFDDGLAQAVPAVAKWLDNASQTRARVMQRDVQPTERPVQAVYDNVLVQLDRARAYPSVAAAVDKGELQLHGWVYDIRTARFSCWNPDTEQFVDLLDHHRGGTG